MSKRARGLDAGTRGPDVGPRVDSETSQRVVRLPLIGFELGDLRLPLIEERDLQRYARSEGNAAAIAQASGNDAHVHHARPPRRFSERDGITERLEVSSRCRDVEPLDDRERLELPRLRFVLR